MQGPPKDMLDMRNAMINHLELISLQISKVQSRDYSSFPHLYKSICEENLLSVAKHNAILSALQTTKSNLINRTKVSIIFCRSCFSSTALSYPQMKFQQLPKWESSIESLRLIFLLLYLIFLDVINRFRWSSHSYSKLHPCLKWTLLCSSLAWKKKLLASNQTNVFGIAMRTTVEKRDGEITSCMTNLSKFWNNHLLTFNQFLQLHGATSVDSQQWI